jgi:hypothetical protein
MLLLLWRLYGVIMDGAVPFCLSPWSLQVNTGIVGIIIPMLNEWALQLG